MIRDLLKVGVRDLTVKEKLLIDSDLNLEKAVEYCRAKESSENQVKFMKEGSSAKSEVVETIKSKQNKKEVWHKVSSKNEYKGKKPDYVKNNRCPRCITKHATGKCPA